MIDLAQRVEVELMELTRVEGGLAEKWRSVKEKRRENISGKLMRSIASGARRRPLLGRSKGCKQAGSECGISADTSIVPGVSPQSSDGWLVTRQVQGRLTRTEELVM